MVKEIKAIIQPFIVRPVLEALANVGQLPAATISQVQGFSIVHPDYEPRVKTKLEIMVPDELVEPVVQALQKHAHTGHPGEGCILVINVEDIVKIRTGEHGTAM